MSATAEAPTTATHAAAAALKRHRRRPCGPAAANKTAALDEIKPAVG
jgi:hypothetical protein